MLVINLDVGIPVYIIVVHFEKICTFITFMTYQIVCSCLFIIKSHAADGPFISLTQFSHENEIKLARTILNINNIHFIVSFFHIRIKKISSYLIPAVEQVTAVI